MARLSNCGKSENGGLYGEPGDQSRQEYWNIGFWSNGWQYVFRHPSASVASLIALYAEHAADNDRIGYSQTGRTTMWQQISFLTGSHDPKNIQNACNADCSSSTMAIIRAVGLDKNIPALASANINGTTYSMIGGELESMGFKRIPFGGESMLNTGDILMTDGHACIVISGHEPTDETVKADNDSESDYVIPMPDIPASITSVLDAVGVNDGTIRYMSARLPIVRPDLEGTEYEFVRSLQILLNAKQRAYLVADGNNTEKTQKAWKQWQVSHADSCGEADGECGAKGWYSILTER